ncbi:hypothetical protein [Pontimicrobium aquaticum]|uniref:Uncharacterized protein n=1 Tax=Pontimicrobium aquaticum TaxID=2565367 RepID=A0A4V5LR47_9FLAO|nr:hypothetical protein [Pontimicrobium aquaticum]TJY37699.1 hypothetical protein E5167_00140 [Pontimicrobium aquaticum]
MKNLLNLGKALTKAQQKQINGGYEAECSEEELCPTGYLCYIPSYICKSESWCNQNTQHSTTWSCN